MHRPKLNLTLTTRVLFTISIWLMAMLMAACSTNIQFSAQVDKPRTAVVQQTKQPVTSNASRKKQQFFAAMKPIVLSENKRILQLRQNIMQYKVASHLKRQQQSWLQHVADDYGFKMAIQPTDEQWQALLARVDIIPVEMALVQAANESAWGQSRFARQGNNYFGQWCYKKGCGMVPNQRKIGATHEVKRFDNMRQSVRAYLRNINTSPAYAEFRSIRHSLRIQSKPLDAYVLVVGLKSYSERGMAYVRTIQSMIRSNRNLIRQSSVRQEQVSRVSAS